MILCTNLGLTAFEGILQTRSSIRTRARFRRPAMHEQCLATKYSITIMRLSYVRNYHPIQFQQDYHLCGTQSSQLVAGSWRISGHHD